MRRALNQEPNIHAKGLTLVELMVALAVISVLAGIALPAVRSTLQEQRVSRAAGVVKAAIEEARARSIARGGGGGIIIDRVGVDNIAQRCSSIQMRYAQPQPAYRGDVNANQCVVGVTPNLAGTLDDEVYLWFPPNSTLVYRTFLDADAGVEPVFFRQGDLVTIGDAGLPLRVGGTIVEGTVAMRNSDFIANASIDAAELLPNVGGAAAGAPSWLRMAVTRTSPNTDFSRYAGLPVSFEFTRRPRPSIALPIELPEGTAIDLTSSGIGGSGNEFSPMWSGDGTPDGNYLDIASPPFAINAALTPAAPTAGQLNYREVIILFGARGEVSRILTAFGNGNDPILGDLPVTGDIHLLVGEAGQVKTAPEDQLELQDVTLTNSALLQEAEWKGDASNDGTTSLLDPESIWVTIKVRTGEVLTAPWTDPTSEAQSLTPDYSTMNADTDTIRQARIRTVIDRVRSAAISSLEEALE